MRLRSRGPAKELVTSAADIATVPDGLDLIKAATVPLTGLAAVQIFDLLGDAPVGANRLLVTGAAVGLSADTYSHSPKSEAGT